MTNEIEKANGRLARSFNGRSVKLSKAELSVALAPMFAAFPGLEMGPDTFNAYYLMLCDIDATALANAVIKACTAHEYPTHLVTVAAIRKAHEAEQQIPGPRNDVDPHTLKAIPQNMYHLDPEEDKRQRMAQLRRTKGWRYDA